MSMGWDTMGGNAGRIFLMERGKTSIYLIKKNKTKNTLKTSCLGAIKQGGEGGGEGGREGDRGGREARRSW